MLQISAELLAMSSDAAVLIKNGRIVFANAEAQALLGSDCRGKGIKTIFGAEVAGVQAGSFIGDFAINGSRYVVRVCSSEGIKALFLSPADAHKAFLSDAFIFSLRNCLMSMDVSLSLLRTMAEEQEKLRHSLAVISQESFRINRILTNVSLVRGMGTKAQPFCPVMIDISGFIRDIVESVSLVTEGPKFRYSGPAELSICADPAMIETLLLNLISNCLLHAKHCRNINIALSRSKERVILSVDDDGAGIAPEQLHQVFDRYNHSFDISDVSRGAGLGLTAARAIAGIHGGTLLLESRQNIGTAVRVSLSMKPSRAKEDAELRKSPEKPYEKTMHNLLTGLAGCLPVERYTEKYLD